MENQQKSSEKDLKNSNQVTNERSITITNPNLSCSEHYIDNKINELEDMIKKCQDEIKELSDSTVEPIEEESTTVVTLVISDTNIEDMKLLDEDEDKDLFVGETFTEIRAIMNNLNEDNEELIGNNNLTSDEDILAMVNDLRSELTDKIQFIDNIKENDQ